MVSGMGSVPQVSILRGPIVKHDRKPKLHQIFSSNATKHPQASALIWEDVQGNVTKCSYAEVEERSNRLARTLIELTKHQQPNGDGDRIIGICLEPSPAVIISILAIWKSGCSYLPFAPKAPINRTKHIVNESLPLLVIADREEDEEIYNPAQCLTFKKLELISKKKSASVLQDDESYKTNDDQIIISLYTSGSTGLSKGVRVRNSSALNRLRWQWRETPFGKNEDCFVFKTALTFVDSVSEIWAPLLEQTRSRTLVIVPSKITTNPQSLVALLHKYQIERLLLVPSLLKAILLYIGLSKENARLISNVKSWVCSGETLPASLASEFFEHFPSGSHHLYNYYGSTEVMGDVTYYTMKSNDDTSINGKVPIGIPVDNTIVYLLDPELRVVNLGQMGELYIAGSHLADGYVNKRDTFRFIDNPHTIDPDYKTLYKTGDYARIVKEVLVFEGRTDSQIKVRGNRVDLSEVEAAINKLPGVQKGVVLCHNPGEPDQQIVGFVLPENDTIIDPANIEKQILNSVPEYALPQVVILKTMPYLVNGKVDRQTLLSTYRQLERNGYDSEENKDFDYSGVPNDRLEEAKCLFSCVSEVLGKSVRGKIDCNANFYTLGGNSLNSVITISKLKDRSFLISITDFIMAENLGEVISKMRRVGDGVRELHDLENSKTKEKYSLRILEEKDKETVLRIVGDSFHKKADIERYMTPSVERYEYNRLLEVIWPYLVNHQVSIVALNKNQEIMGANLAFVLEKEPEEVDFEGRLSYVLEFLDYLEAPIKSMIPEKNVIHSFMLGTDQRLSAQENVEITEFLEINVTKLAKEKGFVGLFTTNTSPLTQQLAKVHNFKEIKSYQVNQYVAQDGTRPFKKGPDDLVAVIAWKEL